MENMDLYTAHLPWLQNPSASSQPSSAPEHNAPPSSVNGGHHDEWKDAGSPTGVGSASGVPSLDLDFGLNDTPPVSSQPSAASPPTTHYYYNYAFTTPAQTAPYGANAWASTSNPNLSAYSSLDGAMSPTASQRPSHPPESSHMIIDPALTTMPGPSNVTYAHSTSPPPLQPSHNSDHQTHSSHYPYLMNNGIPYLDPRTAAAFAQFYTMNARQAQQHQNPGQGSLSPAALHSPTVINSLPPSSFYQPSADAPPSAPSSVSSLPSAPAPQPPAQPQESPEARRERLVRTLKPLLLSNSFSGAGAVVRLIDTVEDFGGAGAIDVPVRLELLTKIRDNAPNHYFRAWSENEDAMDVTREWLKAGVTGKGEQAMETIMPLLHIIDRLPLTVEGLRNSKLGKIIMKLVKEPPAPAIKDMASNIERRWRQLVEGHKGGEDNTQEAKVKKRKTAEPPATKAGPPAKKQATGASTKTAATSAAPSPSALAVAVKKEKKATPAAPAVKDAKSDSSFFSAPKPKPKLPTFKKAPVPMSAAGVAQPSAIDPFQEALTAMKARKASPVTVAPTPPPASAAPGQAAGLAKNGRKRKSVSWRPDGQSEGPGMLEHVKLIERAIYDDDPKDGSHPMHDIRDLERAEGAALHAHASFEEAIDWSEPLALELPALDLPERGNASAEKAIQEERELTALAPLYMSDSPAELPGPQSTEELDKDVVHMLTGPEADAVFWLPAPDAGAGAVPAPLPTPAVSVSDLVGQLAGGALLQQQQQHSIAPEQIQQILAQLQPALYNQQQGQQQASVPGSSHLVGQQQTAAGFYGGNGQDEDWNQGQYPFGGGLQPPQPGGWDGGAGRGPWQGHQTGDGIGGRGRGGGGGFGRGRGRGGFNSKRIPCKFYPQGSCRRGDACEFSHEMPPQPGY